MNEPNGALSGLRILDLTRVLAGPFCTMMLADMGAEVIKIEQPGRGDDTRHFAPFCNGESAYYMNLNRGKQGVTLDLKSRPRPVPRPREDGRRGGGELPPRHDGQARPRATTR